MAYDDERARIFHQPVFQQVQGLGVQVVGGFVHDEHVAGPGEQPRQQQAVALPAGEHAHRAVGPLG